MLDVTLTIGSELDATATIEAGALDVTVTFPTGLEAKANFFGTTITIDSTLSETSTNPLENKKIYALFAQLAPAIIITEIDVTWE